MPFHLYQMVFFLLTYFIVITSPISLYLVKRSNTKDLSLVKNSIVHNAKLTKDASSSYSSITAHLNLDHPDMLLRSDKGNKFMKLLRHSGRKPLSVQSPLLLVSSNIGFPNATNLKKQHKSSESEVRISSKIPNEFLNIGTKNNLTDLHAFEHDVSTINTKHTGNASNNPHSPVLENLLSSSNTSNASNQSSFVTSPVFENNSSVISILSTVLDASFNSSNNSTSETPLNDFTSLSTHPSKETTETDSPSTDGEGKGMTSGAIAGVVIAVLATGMILTGTVIFFLYQKCGKSNKLESKCPSDNCGYVDDTLRSSGYLSNHIELPKESSEEMTSLDNDSFLNSLESMTFQNYWADNTKNTKV